MNVTKTRLVYAGVILVIVYWIPAWFFPTITANVVNSLFTVVSAALAVVLLPDMWSIVVTRGVGLSWQALLAKIGLFILTAAYSVARAWALIAAVSDFPSWMIHSPIGTFFFYVMGIGLASILYGLESVGDIRPRITFQGAIVAGIAIGVVIGLSLAQIR